MEFSDNPFIRFPHKFVEVSDDPFVDFFFHIDANKNSITFSHQDFEKKSLLSQKSTGTFLQFSLFDQMGVVRLEFPIRSYVNLNLVNEMSRYSG